MDSCLLDEIQNCPSSSPTTVVFRKKIFNDREFGTKRWSCEETLAFLLAVKIRHGLSDEAFFALLEGENASMISSSVTRTLPVSMYKTSKELDGYVPFHFKYVTYCPKCETIIDTTSKALKEAKCLNCGDDLRPLLAKGLCTFVVVPVRKQIEAYCSRPKFRSLVRKFRCAKHGRPQGDLHRGVVDEGHFDVTVATDGAVLSKWSKTTLFPIFLFFNNIPISYQVVYPVLCALYCGPSNMTPPRHVFFSFLVEELRNLEVEPIIWEYDNGEKVESLTFVTMCATDAVEKAKVMNHKGHSGYFSCPYCKYKGRSVVRKATSLFPVRPGMKATSNNTGKVKFPKLLHEGERPPWRSGKERFQIGLSIVQEVQRTGEIPKESVDGVLGLGVLNGFKHFDETDSHTAGMLHLVCEGIFKDIITLAVKTVGEPYSLKKKEGNWDHVDKLLDSRTRVSEANYNCKSPRVFNSWRAYDFYQLLMHDVCLLFSDERIITDEGFQNAIFLLSDSVYYLSHGRMTSEIRKLARKKVEQFSQAFVHYFGPEWCTYKFHVFQHAPDLADRHGPAFLWDDFNLERINHLAKETVTGTRGQTEQATKHFLLKNHSDVLQDPSKYQESVQTQLKKTGFHQEVFYTYDDFITHTFREPLGGAEHDLILEYLISKEMCEVGENIQLTRVSRMVRKNVVVLTSKHFKHKGKVADRYVMVNEELFGEIGEIVYCVETASFIVILEKFKKYDALYSKGNTVMHPCNQFPYKSSDEVEVFELTDEVFVQKAQISCLVLAEGTIVNLFSVRPNEFFRF